ncbi:hypothetical protein ACLOJK_039874 [Asimina triloba]
MTTSGLLLSRARCLRLLQQLPQLMTTVDMDINQLKQLHAQMITNGLCEFSSSSSLPLRNLAEGYSALSAPQYVWLLYQQHQHQAEQQYETDEKRRFLWNLVIRNATPKEAILLYAYGRGGRSLLRPHHTDGVGDAVAFLVPDNQIFISVLVTCARSLSFWEGKQIHGQILKSPLASSDVVVQTAGIHFYVKCRDIHSARLLFDGMPLRASITWNAMISGYASHGRRLIAYAQEALLLFQAMLLAQMQPTGSTMVGLLSACSHMGVLLVGSCIHGYISKTIPFSDKNLFIGTALIDMYSKCGCLNCAMQVFEGINERNALTWTTMIAGLAFHGRGKEALNLLNAMQIDNVVPNEVTFTCLLSACCHTGLVVEGVKVFNIMTSSRFSITPRIQHYGCIVDLLGRAGLIGEAYEFIKKIPLQPDPVLWRALLGACKLHGNVFLGERVGKILLVQQREEEMSDYVALSNIYASTERWEDVVAVRDAMRAKSIYNKPGYSCIQVDKLAHSFMVNIK